MSGLCSCCGSWLSRERLRYGTYSDECQRIISRRREAGQMEAAHRGYQWDKQKHTLSRKHGTDRKVKTE